MDIARVSQAFLLSTFFLLAGFLHICDCADCTTLPEQVAQCYTDNNLTAPAIMNVQSPTSLSYVNGQLCPHPDAAAKAISCHLRHAVDCLSSLIPELADYLPSPNKTTELVKIMCRNIALYDQTCVNNQSPKIASCARTQVEETDKLNSLDIGAHECKSFNATYSCMRPYLEPCGCVSYQVMTDIYKGPAWPILCAPPEFDTYQCDPKNPKLFIGLKNSGSQMVPIALLFFLMH